MDHVLEVWQGGIMVAQVVGADASQVRADALHYAMIYGQDGPCEIRGGDVKALFDAVKAASE